MSGRLQKCWEDSRLKESSLQGRRSSRRLAPARGRTSTQQLSFLVNTPLQQSWSQHNHNQYAFRKPTISARAQTNGAMQLARHHQESRKLHYLHAAAVVEQHRLEAQLIAMQASFVAVRQLTQQLDRDLPRLQQLLEHQMQDDMNDQAEDLSESGDSSAVGPASANKEADKDLTKLPQLH